MLNGVDLFTGIGGISLALQPWVRTVCYVEIEPYCQQLLRERIADGQLDDAPIWDDITTFDGEPWAGAVDSLQALLEAIRDFGEASAESASNTARAWSGSLPMGR